NEKPITVTPGSVDLFDYPFVHMTGHGNVYFSAEEAENLRNYLISGGFLHIDDNYGMDQYIRKEIIKLFPNKEIRELPVNHPIFTTLYIFPQGLHKSHEHDGGRPQTYDIYEEDRLVLQDTIETDLDDGWEEQEVPNDQPKVGLIALQRGAKIGKYV